MKTTEEMIEVMQAHVDGKRIETRHVGAWHTASEPEWNWAYSNYRISLTKPSINWDHVDNRYNWMARGQGGLVFLHEEMPVNLEAFWSRNGRVMSAHSHASLDPGTCNWKDSLVERPNR